MFMKNVLLMILIICIFPFMVLGRDSKSYLLPIDGELKAKVVALHNKYRAEVGVPPVKWSGTVQKSSEEWALHLAENEGLRMVHAKSKGPYGENLSGGPGVWSTGKDAYTALEAAVIGFGNEKNNYNDTPVSVDNSFYKYGHYTQIVWRTTTEIGCAVAKRKDIPGYVVVCRYNPAGNMIGQKPY
jgi:pathogenesis-related protein 1